MLRRHDLREGAVRGVRDAREGLLHELDLFAADGDHVVDQRPAHARLDLVDLDAEALRSPPGLKALLGRPQLPQVRHGGLVAALEGHRQGAFPGTGLTRHAVFLCVFLRARPEACCFFSSASAKRVRRASHRRW